LFIETVNILLPKESLSPMVGEFMQRALFATDRRLAPEPISLLKGMACCPSIWGTNLPLSSKCTGDMSNLTFRTWEPSEEMLLMSRFDAGFFILRLPGGALAWFAVDFWAAFVVLLFLFPTLRPAAEVFAPFALLAGRRATLPRFLGAAAPATVAV
jgi:hypothetical protein